jgi:hypothetical protein
LLVLLLALAVGSSLSAQIGGRHVYSFLDLAPAGRLAALGGVNLTTYDHDLNFAYQNPALVNDSMHQQLSFSITNYLSDITYGYAGYAHSFEGIGDFHAGVQYLSYGKMQAADEYGNVTGQFGSKDIALVVGGSRMFDQFRGGVNLKLLNSSISGYQSHWGVGMDVGGLYVSESGLFTAAMVFRNMGFNLTRYNLPEELRSPLPFDAQMGVSAKLKHMPLRFSATVTNLTRPNLIYVDPNPVIEYDLSGNPIEPKKQFADKLFRHFVFGGEFLITRNFNLRAGYNHLRRAELRSANRGGVSGFSFGAGIKISKFRFDYGFSSFHAIGGTHNFTISTNLGEYKKKGAN